MVSWKCPAAPCNPPHIFRNPKKAPFLPRNKVSAMKMRAPANPGFTLIELLVVVAIILVLAALGLSVSKAMITNARKITEINAAKNLLAAYATAATDRSGSYLPGYDRTIGSIPGPGGVLLSGPAAERYPWRLTPYLGDNPRGTLLVGANATQLDPNDTYMVSCYPALGINYIFVGGDEQTDGTLTYPPECITRASNSASVLVFASACGSGTSGPGGNASTDPAGGSPTGVINGYCILTPPNLTGPMWNTAPWSASSSPSDYGNIDARFNGKAVCAFLDGSVRMESIADLRDMQLWSRTAAQTGNASYLVPDTTQRGSRLH